MTIDTTARPASSRRPPTPARETQIKRALQRFPDTVRPRVSALAGEHDRLADLALSFPGLLAAIATAATGLPRNTARERIIAGAPLRRAAQALDLAWWLRRLPPEAFDGRVARLPDDDLFGCRVANIVPEETNRLTDWLQIVSAAWRNAGPAFALWAGQHGLEKSLAARRRRASQRHLPAEQFRGPLDALALFAWHSQSRIGAAGALIREPWHPRMGGEEARKQADGWLDRVLLTLFTSRGARLDPWLPAAASFGFEMVAIRTAIEVLEEASAMGNCLATYGSALARNDSSLWSIRRQGERVATLELYRCEGQCIPIVAQIKAAGNEEAAEDVWRAAYQWLAQQPFNVPMAPAPDELISRPEWQAMWLPYWRAMGVKSWLPVAPSRTALWMLSNSL